MNPRPASAATNSDTMAPMMARVAPIWRPPKMAGRALGMRSLTRICQGEARSDRMRVTASGSASEAEAEPGDDQWRQDDGRDRVEGAQKRQVGSAQPGRAAQQQTEGEPDQAAERVPGQDLGHGPDQVALEPWGLQHARYRPSHRVRRGQQDGGHGPALSSDEPGRDPYQQQGDADHRGRDPQPPEAAGRPPPAQ